jgi:cell division protein FtsW
MKARLLRPADPVLLILALVATLGGLFFIFDAGYARSIRDNYGVLPREFRSQLMVAGISILLSGAVMLVPIQRWEKLAKPIFWFTVVLAFLVAVPGIGMTMSGATRWIKFGPIQIQPSEFLKVSVVMFLAAALAGRKAWPTKIKRPKDFADRLDRLWIPKLVRAIPFLLVIAVCLKVEREPDLGTAAVIMATAFAMLFLGGVSKKSLAYMAVIGLVGVFFIAKLEPYRLERITNHGERWSSEHVDDVGFQTTQSETAMAAGGLVGVGVGAGRAKHILPAATTDFVMTTIAEETGLMGAIVVCAILAGIVFRLFYLSAYSQSDFARLVLQGIACCLAIQASVNVMMANGTLPPIGIPLPFFSSGGSSLIALWIAIGVAQSACAEQPTLEGRNEGHRNGWRNWRSRLSGS